MICVRISHAIAAVLTTEADAPIFDQGDTEENPRPVPSESRMSASEANTNAPPTTAAHDMPEEEDSLLLGTSANGVRLSRAGRGTVNDCIGTPLFLLEYEVDLSNL